MPSTSLRASRLTTVAAASGATNWLNRATWRLFDAQGNLSPLVTATRSGTATFFNSSGILQNAAANTPRVSYDPAALSLGPFLLAEESRTNIVFPSDTLTTQTRTVTAVAHTLSFYGTGTVTLSGATTATVTGIGAFPQRRVFTFTPAAGNLTLTVSGSVTLAQLEVGSTASSYIPTTTAAVTRSADNLSVTNLAATGFNATEGTLYVDFQTPAILNAVPCALSVDNGSTSNRYQLRRASNRSSALLRIASSSGNVDFEATSGVAGQRQKQALSYIAGAQVYSADGNIFKNFTSVTTLPVVNRIQLGQGPGSNTLQGSIYQAAIIPQRVPDSGLQRLTRV